MDPLRSQRGRRVGGDRSVRWDQHAWGEVEQAVQGCECGRGGVGSVECDVDPANVVVGQGIADDEEPLVGLPQTQVARSVPGSADGLPLGVTERHDLGIVELLVDGVRGDGLIEVLGLAAARVATGDRIGVRGAGGDPGPPGLQHPVAPNPRLRAMSAVLRYGSVARDPPVHLLVGDEHPEREGDHHADDRAICPLAAVRNCPDQANPLTDCLRTVSPQGKLVRERRLRSRRHHAGSCRWYGDAVRA